MRAQIVLNELNVDIELSESLHVTTLFSLTC